MRGGGSDRKWAFSTAHWIRRFRPLLGWANERFETRPLSCGVLSPASVLPYVGERLSDAPGLRFIALERSHSAANGGREATVCCACALSSAARARSGPSLDRGPGGLGRRRNPGSSPRPGASLLPSLYGTTLRDRISFLFFFFPDRPMHPSF